MLCYCNTCGWEWWEEDTDSLEGYFPTTCEDCLVDDMEH